jgi:hypothetical protein
MRTHLPTHSEVLTAGLEVWFLASTIFYHLHRNNGYKVITIKKTVGIGMMYSKHVSKRFSPFHKRNVSQPVVRWPREVRNLIYVGLQILICVILCPYKYFKTTWKLASNFQDSRFLLPTKLRVLNITCCCFIHRCHNCISFRYTNVYPKVSGLSHNEINKNNKHSLRSKTKDYGGKTH